MVQPKANHVPNETPSSVPGEKKSGALQEAGKGTGEAPVPAEEREGKPEEKGMSQQQAEFLLRSVKEEEQQIKLQQHDNAEEVRRDW